MSGANNVTYLSTQATYDAPSARGEPMDMPAGVSPPTVPELGAEDATAAEIEPHKAELAEKTENLRDAQEELRQANLVAARAPEHAVTSPRRRQTTTILRSPPCSTVARCPTKTKRRSRSARSFPPSAAPTGCRSIPDGA